MRRLSSRPWASAPLALCLAACAVGGDGPAPADSPASQRAAALTALAAEADAIATKANEITALADAARAEADASPEVRAARIAQVQALAAELVAQDAALQAKIDEIEAGLHTDAGDPAPPTPPTPRKR
jgi:hypothetical protein